VLIGCLISSYLALQFFLRAKDPVGEGERGPGDWYCARTIDGGIERELGALDQVVEHAVLEADELGADVGEGEEFAWFRHFD